MSSIAQVEMLTEEPVSGGFGRVPLRAVAVVALMVLGSVALFPMWGDAIHLWSEDPLRSIGAAFPVVSVLLVVWRWREIGYRVDGSWWGLGLVVLAGFGARVFNAAKLEWIVGGHRVGLLHPGMVLFCYGVGCVLLFGGMPLLRKAIVPLCLLLLLNPVPREFNTMVDLPLQTLSANTARGFAHLIGLQPTGAQLKMMFAPDFGMMIVPGCNGVRGSVTLCYLALIFGYTRRLRWKELVVLGLGGFVLGYVLNLTRLCVLVIYYRVGLVVTSIQRYGVEIDYVIGCTIFLCATLGIGVAVRFYQLRAERAGGVAVEPVVRGSGRDLGRNLGRDLGMRAGVFALLAVGFILPQLKAMGTPRPAAPGAADAMAAMPVSVAGYRLMRTYTEHDTNGNVSLVLGDYAAAEAGKPGFTLGLWLGGSNHFVANSKLYQGVRPRWNGTFDALSAGAKPVHFIGNYYDDGVNRSYDAETACSSSGCTETLVEDPTTGVVMSSPSVADLAMAKSVRRLPVLLRREWVSSGLPETALRQEFESDARSFVGHLDMSAMVERAGSF